MNVRDFIASYLGGAPVLTDATGLTRARISQWQTHNYIPPKWEKALRAARPNAPWHLLEMAESDVAGRAARRAERADQAPVERANKIAELEAKLARLRELPA